jgi:hypothetical protein
MFNWKPTTAGDLFDHPNIFSNLGVEARLRSEIASLAGQLKVANTEKELYEQACKKAIKELAKISDMEKLLKMNGDTMDAQRMTITNLSERNSQLNAELNQYREILKEYCLQKGLEPKVVLDNGFIIQM